jgi:hypothetical protein
VLALVAVVGLANGALFKAPRTTDDRVIFKAPDLLVGAVLFVSLALTYLSASAWFRITKTFMTGLWNYWRFTAPSELATACLRDASGCVRQPDTRQPSIDAGAC